MRKPSKYKALLQTVAVLSEQQRSSAETRYLEILEQTFGSASRVRGAYCEYVAVCALRTENPWDSMTAEESQAISLWEQASKNAAAQVFSQLQIADNDAAFELHVWNSRSG